MKKIVSIILAATMMMGLAACNKTEEKKADGGKNFVIATDKGFSPFEFQDADGKIVGIDMDILAAIAEDQGFTYDLQYVGWDAAIAACQAGQADGLIAGASITDERKERAGHSQTVTMMQLRVWQLQKILISTVLTIWQARRLLLRTVL